VISDDVILGTGVSIPQPELINLYGCRIGDRTRIGPFVEIQKGVVVGCECKISSHVFICTGVAIEDGVFVGHGVMFTNDLYPKAVREDGLLQTEEDWQMLETLVRSRVAIGSNATILGGVTIGCMAMVGAGAVVTRDVADYAVVAGVPARIVGDIRELREPERSRIHRVISSHPSNGASGRGAR